MNLLHKTEELSRFENELFFILFDNSKPTDNPFHFRALTQQDQESFPAFCNRVEKGARHCRFNGDNENCSNSHWDTL
jgi:hypothetical protein